MNLTEATNHPGPATSRIICLKLELKLFSTFPVVDIHSQVKLTLDKDKSISIRI